MGVIETITSGDIPGILTLVAIVAVPVLILILVVVVGGFALYMGWLNPKPFSTIIRVPRAMGGYKTLIGRGRRLKDGTFEIDYGKRQLVSVNGPPDDCVAEGNILEGLSLGKNEVLWFKKLVITDNEKRLIAKAGKPGEKDQYDMTTSAMALALIPEGAELAFATAFAAAYERTHRLNVWMQYLPFVAVVIFAIIVGIGLFIYGSMISDGNHASANALNRYTDTLANSTIVVYRNESINSLRGFPNAPAPPG